MSARVKHVDKSVFKNYLRKAEECLTTASECLKTGRWNAAVINAVHCGISACDALTVFMLGIRHAGERHEDAISLLQAVDLPKDILTAKSKQLSRLLGVKNIAEYEERLMDEDDAREAVRDAERFLGWVREFLSK
ncbi:MAG: HEPN domain-containing protein [Thermoproteota archaeon]